MRTPLPILATAVTLVSATECRLPRATLEDSPQSRQAEAAGPWESLGATILFAVGSSDIDAVAMQTLDGLVLALSRARTESVAVEGLANEHHHLETNLELADRRAQAVTRYLASRGIGRARYVAIGRESSPDDPQGGRCIIEPL